MKNSEDIMTKRLEDMTLEELWQLFPISLVPHDERWKDMFARERRRIAGFLTARPVRISHIGSTALDGIYAKDIVDILVEVPEDASFERCAGELSRNGYILMSAQQNRMSFNRGYTPEGFAEEVFHLHLRHTGDNDELYFRDYLALFPDCAKEYEKLKLSLCEEYRHDRDGYTSAKGGFVQATTLKARELLGGKYDGTDEGFIL